MPAMSDSTAPTAWLRLIILTMLHFIVDFFAGLRTPLAEPTLVEHLQCSLGDVLIIFSIAGVVTNFIQPLSGALLPKRGLPQILILAPILGATAALIGLTQSYWGNAALLVLSGIGIGVLHPEGMMAAHALSGKRQSLGAAIYISGGFFGYSLGGLVGGAWASAWDLRGLWLLAVAALPICVLAWLTGLHRLEGHVEAEAPRKLRHILPFWLVLLFTILIATNVRLMLVFITPFLVRTFGKDAQIYGGGMLFAFGLAGSLMSYFWAWLSERWGRCRVIALTQLVNLPFLYFFLHLGKPVMAAVWGAALGAFMGGIFPLAVMLGRGCPGKPSRLRNGLIIGGAWGATQVFTPVAGKWVDLYPAGDATPIHWLLKCSAAGCLVILVMALAMVRSEEAGIQKNLSETG